MTKIPEYIQSLLFHMSMKDMITIFLLCMFLCIATLYARVVFNHIINLFPSWIFSLIFYGIDVNDVNCLNIDIEVDCIHCKSVKSIPTRFSATLWPTLKSGTRCYSTARALLGQVHRTVASSPNTRRQAPPPPLWRPPSKSSHSGRAPGRLTPTYTPCFPGWATSSTLAGWTGRLPRTIPNLCSPSITGRRVRPADPVPIAENTKWCCKEHKSVKTMAFLQSVTTCVKVNLVAVSFCTWSEREEETRLRENGSSSLLKNLCHSNLSSPILIKGRQEPIPRSGPWIFHVTIKVKWISFISIDTLYQGSIFESVKWIFLWLISCVALIRSNLVTPFHSTAKQLWEWLALTLVAIYRDLIF